MKIRKILTLIFMTLLFAFSLGAENSEIENTWVTNNPNAPITTIKTNRQKKEGAKLNIEVNKVKSREINGVINRNKKEVYFNLTDLEKPVSENDIVYVTEELETFPSVAETNGKKRYSNVMEKYINAYKNNTPVENNGLKSVVLTNDKSEDADGQPVKWKKALKVSYENEPASLFIGVLEKKTYELKSIYAWYNIGTLEIKTYTASITYTANVLSEMTVDNFDTALGYVGNFDNKMDITKDLSAVTDSLKPTDEKYINITRAEGGFLNISPLNDLKTVKIYQEDKADDGSTVTNSVELDINSSIKKQISLSDGSLFYVNAVKDGTDKLKLSLIPVIFGTKNKNTLNIDLYGDDKNTPLSYNSLEIIYPKNISHTGITIKPLGETKNALSPRIEYTFGKADNDLADNIDTAHLPRNYWYFYQDNSLGYADHGFRSEGKAATYGFYLLKVIENLEGNNFSFENTVTAVDSSFNPSLTFNDRTITLDYGEGADKKIDGKYGRRKLSFRLNENSITMKVPDWDMSSITQLVRILIKKDGKDLYSIPITLSLPKTGLVTGNIYFQLYTQLTDYINKYGKALFFITPHSENLNEISSDDLLKEYGVMEKIDGKYPIPKHLIGAMKFRFGDGNTGTYNSIADRYISSTVESGDIDGIKIGGRYIYYDREPPEEETLGGFSIEFQKAMWEKFVNLKSKIIPELSISNDYDLEIGKFTYEMSILTQRERTMTFDNFAGIPGVNANSTITTGNIYGASQDKLYSVFNSVGGTGEIIGNSLSGDKLRYYDVGDDYYAIIKDENGKIIGEEFADENAEFVDGDAGDANSSTIKFGFSNTAHTGRMDTSEKSLYIRLGLKPDFWNNGNEVRKTYTIIIKKSKIGDEVYRDKLNLILKKTVPNEISANIFIDENYTDEFTVDGNYLIGKDGQIVGAVEYEKGKAGEIVPDLTTPWYRASFYDSTTNIIAGSGLDLLSGKDFIYKANGDKVKITLKAIDDENKKKKFVYKVWFDKDYDRYTEFGLKTYAKPNATAQDTPVKTYKFYIELGKLNINSDSFSTMNVNFNKDNFNTFIKNSIEKPIEFFIKTDDGVPRVDDNSSYLTINDYKIGEMTDNSAKGFFVRAINSSFYILLENSTYKAVEDFTRYDNTNGQLPSESVRKIENKVKNIILSDQSKMTFGAGISQKKVTSSSKPAIYAGDIYFEIESFGDGIYPSSNTNTDKNYSMVFSYPGSIRNLQSTFEITMPKLEPNGINISLKDGENNKNGLCPKYPYYFGYNDGIDKDGNYSNHAVSVLKGTGGENPFIFYRAGETPQLDYHNFFEFVSTTQDIKTSKLGNSWVIKYGDDNKKEITFDILGFSTTDENGINNRIRMKINKWDETAIKDTINLNVYSTTRKAHLTIPINIDIPATFKTEGGDLEVILNDNYTGSVVNKLEFADGDTDDKNQYPDKDVFKVVDNSGRKVGILLAEKGKFDPVRNVKPGNILRGAVKFKINGEEVSDGKYHEDGAFKLGFSFSDLGISHEGKLQMGVSTMTGGFKKEFPLEFENDYGVTIAEYNLIIRTKSFTADNVVFDFGDISPANRYFETSAEAVVELDDIIQKIEVSLSDYNPVLTLGGKNKNSADPKETLQSNLYVRSVSKSRIDSKKWEIDLIGRLKPITVADQKAEGQYWNPDSVSLIIEVPESTVGTQKIKK